MELTVKENGLRVANPYYKGQKFTSDHVRDNFIDCLLTEMGFKLDDEANEKIKLDGLENEVAVYVHRSEDSLQVVWDKLYECKLRVWRRDFFIDHLIVGVAIDLYFFVSEFLQSVREVWVS